jgi:hypothetical protein
VWTANSNVYNSEQNVDRAVIAALDTSITDDFKSGGVATNGWSGNINVREIIANLKDKYGTPGPADKAKIEAIYMKPYNPSRPIESMFKELETGQMMFILAHVPYSDAQILDKALTKIQVTNQYRNALVDWALLGAEDATNNNCDAFKEHFIQAYTANQAALTVTHGWRLSWSRKYDRRLPRRRFLRIHPNQSCQSPNGQQRLGPSNQQRTLQTHSEHTATNLAVSRTNGDVGKRPTNANDAKPHAYTHLQHAIRSPPGANGKTTSHATQHPGIHTLPSTHGTKQPNKLLQRRQEKPTWRKTHRTTAKYCRWQVPFVWPHPATKQSNDSIIWPTTTNTILQHHQTFCELELLLYLWV